MYIVNKYYLSLVPVKETGLLRVKEVAESKGYSILRLSRESGIGYKTVLQYWHNRLKRIDTDVLQKLARTLHVSVKDLIEDEPE